MLIPCGPTQNISKGQVVQCVKDGAQSVADVKTKTKAGTGCGGCTCLDMFVVQLYLIVVALDTGVPLLTSIVKVWSH